MGIYLSVPQKDKTYDEKKGPGLIATSAQMQGWRKSMEDAKLIAISQDSQTYPSLFGVFDGHGGLEVSNLASKHFPLIFDDEFKKLGSPADLKPALKNAFLKFDEFITTEVAAAQALQIRKDKGEEVYAGAAQTPQSGSTACVVAFYKNKIFCANAGDSRAVLSLQGQLKQLSFDHKPQNPTERQRIEAAGGVISNARIDNGLNLSRALGDLMYKNNSSLPPERQKVISVPDFVQHEITGKQTFLFIGCDGVWQNYVDNSRGMVEWLTQLRAELPTAKDVLTKLLDTCLAPKVSDTGCDNMTALLIEFTK